MVMEQEHKQVPEQEKRKDQEQEQVQEQEKGKGQDQKQEKVQEQEKRKDQEQEQVPVWPVLPGNCLPPGPCPGAISPVQGDTGFIHLHYPHYFFTISSVTLGTLGRGCIAQIRARVLHRLFLKSIWSKDFKTIFFVSRMN